MKKLILKDTTSVKNIIVQVNLKNGSTTVFSNFSSWENLALILEGLGVTAEKCISEGISQKKVYKAIQNYMMKVLTDYKIPLSS